FLQAKGEARYARSMDISPSRGVIVDRNNQLLAQTLENSIRDSLTGCFNRAYAMDALKAELQRAQRKPRDISVMMLDIDDFKSVNDRFGHLTGDAILAAVGAQLTAALRSTDLKCRYGGDEFLVILPDTPLGGAQRAASALLAEVSRIAVEAQGVLVSPTISIGVASALDHETEIAPLVGRADAAMYEAKRAGRNRVASRLAPAG
ncbi:MAG: GGDEF domain-containing protein, partial [Vicinamibacterales bacterium]